MTRKPKILVVEDSAYWQKAIKVVLEKYGYVCECVGNAAQAIIRLSWEDFDFVVLDYELRYWDSDSVESFIAKKHVPACIFTAHVRGEIKDKTRLPIVEKINDGYTGLLSAINSSVMV